MAPGAPLPIQNGLSVSFNVDFPGAAEDFVLVGANQNRIDIARRDWLPVTPDKLGWKPGEMVLIYIAYTSTDDPDVFYFSPNPITVQVH